MAYELEHADVVSIRFGDGRETTLKAMWEEKAATLRALGWPLEPDLLTVASLKQQHIDWLDVQVPAGRISPDAPIWQWRLSLLPQRATDLVAALVGRARQVGRTAPRPRERRARRSGSSRDGPDDPPDDPDDVDRARRGGDA